MLKEFKKIDYVLLLLCVLLFLIFINYLVVSITTLYYPYDVDYSEGFILFSSLKFLHDEILYQEINLPPFSIINYTPLFFVINGLTIIIFGTNLFSARIISFVVSLAIAYMVYLIVYEYSKKKFLGIVSSLLFFSSFVTFFIGSLARVDVLAAFFSILGIYFMAKHDKSRYLILAIGSFILSLLTKQTFIAAPIASFFYLLFNDRKKSLKFLAGFLLPTLFIIFLINYSTNDQFLLHMLSYNVGFLTFDYNLFMYIFLSNLIILCISIYYFKISRNLLSLYFIFSLIIILLQLFRPGGSTYYFFELTIITSAIAGLLVNHFKSQPDKKIFLIFIIFLQLILFIQRDPRALFFIFKPNDYPPLVNLVIDEKISSYVKNSTGNVMIEHATFARLNGKEVPPEVSSLYELQKNNMLQETEILEFLKDRNYSLIIYYSRFNLIQGLGDNIKNNYKLIDELNWKSLEGVNWVWRVYEKK
jgi:hypothetical protein